MERKGSTEVLIYFDTRKLVSEINRLLNRLVMRAKRLQYERLLCSFSGCITF